jgi:hypothetical protein
VFANIFINRSIESISDGGNARILEAREDLRNFVLRAGGRHFIELDDGELGYVMQMPAMSGLGLALDQEANQARRSGHFFDLATKRDLHVVAGRRRVQDVHGCVAAEHCGG